MRISTVNVNGIRAAERRGLGSWLAERAPDVVALQEVRCPVEQLPTDLLAGWEWAYDAGTLAGRNGVAVMSRTPFAEVRVGFGNKQFAHEGRYIEVDLGEAPITVGSLYLPKGDVPDGGPAAEKKYRRKMRFMASFARYLTKARLAAAARGREFVVMGDFNVAHTERDLKNWRTNRKSEGFLPEERAWFGSLLGPRTLHDVVRRLHPDQDGPYSWWSWRGQAFANDAGWRIDYHLASRGLAEASVSGGTDRDADYESRISDHAPVTVDYDV
ncbi:exodeoxyribonuclease III [Parenemella sanctibonifatiensis]|uniref:Exodeoxyribonuclease III n=1 Tax=Parenemella sanctibonifatiensis TaxID=2016505 RepID=A0A255ED13_9ACTN|nr:exodeoxyribonuclease III [Parenemella sanctibonifatiensis]OYN87679.1 exodeoxyribonuclease III [Parenemella sanctibonifatiensis]OYN89170.1 exodeoxyribonuclease III [Parenemella sanctibonifatiensis]